MSDSADDTCRNAKLTPRCSITKQALQEDLKGVTAALTDGLQVRDIDVEDSTLLACGAYNDIWLVTLKIMKTGTEGSLIRRFVLREPKDDALLPYQLDNEIAWLTYVSRHCSIPTPKVYAYSIEQNPFIAMEYVEGEPLSDAWRKCNKGQKKILAEEIADLIVKMGEARFDQIGGMTPAQVTGPTVEGVKFFKGRDKFHSYEHYNIGPYASIVEYVLAYYDKEILYYSQAPAEDIDWTFFTRDDENMIDFLPVSGSKRQELLDNKSAFVDHLKQVRKRIASSPDQFPKEPFVLCHGDLEGRNILVRDGHVAAVIDWEFGGSYPLSELLGGMGFHVVEHLEDGDMYENSKWSNRILGHVESKVKARNWLPEDVKLLFSDGNHDLQMARMEMMPDYVGGEEENYTIKESLSFLERAIRWFRKLHLVRKGE